MILEINGVTKHYDKHCAVNNVSFAMPKGGIFGLLGPNGAGKTSLIRMITTITKADSGTIFLDGELLNAKHPERIGYMPEERGLYKKMKVGEQLMYLAQLKGMTAPHARREIEYWLNKFEIQHWWNKKVEELSKGMQQKAQFISTVLHQPELLILDEPFSGLDPLNANLIKDEIYELNRKGTSIIFSTHRMEQVEEICTRMVLINKGQNILEGEVAEVKNRFKKNLFSVQYNGALDTAIFDGIAEVTTKTDKEVVLHLLADTNANDILSILLQKNIPIIGFNEILPSLNEIFIQEVSGKGINQ